GSRPAPWYARSKRTRDRPSVVDASARGHPEPGDDTQAHLSGEQHMTTRPSSSPLLTTMQAGSTTIKVSPAELRLLQACVRFSLRYTHDPVLAAQLGQLQVRLGVRAVATAA